MGLSTHVLNQVNGQPAEGLKVTVYKGETVLGTFETDHDGRCGDLLNGEALEACAYRLVFSAGAFLKGMEYLDTPFFDEIEVKMNITDLGRHYHIPLLLSPYGYSTYRGS